MKRIFCDTSFLFALRNREDPLHGRARQVLQERILEFYPSVSFVITDYIFDEAVTLMMKRESKAMAIETARFLSGPDFRLAFIGERLFQKAVEIFAQYGDKRWSFTDCTSFVWLEEAQPDFFLAADVNFKQFGLPMPNLMEGIP